MTKITGPGSISQRHGSADPDPDPDPHQNGMDVQHWYMVLQILLLLKLSLMRSQFGSYTVYTRLCHGVLKFLLWVLFWFLTVVVKVLFGVTVVRIHVLFQAFIAVAATSDVAFTGGVIFYFLRGC